jgi:DNA-binding HxlR family transcriptional regulator
MARRADSSGSLKTPLGELDRLLEHRTRLAIVVLLSRNDAINFSRLKDLLGETDGSLGSHLLKLEEEGRIVARKEFKDRKPVTWYSLTKRGRETLVAHLGALDRLIRQAAGGR